MTSKTTSKKKRHGDHKGVGLCIHNWELTYNGKMMYTENIYQCSKCETWNREFYKEWLPKWTAKHDLT